MNIVFSSLNTVVRCALAIRYLILRSRRVNLAVHSGMGLRGTCLLRVTVVFMEHGKLIFDIVCECTVSAVYDSSFAPSSD